MKQKIYYLIALCFAVSTVTYAQNIEPETITYLLRNTQEFTVFNRLVEACGLQSELSKIRDEEYEKAYLTGLIKDLARHPTEEIGTLPEHRYYGYTIFAEPDAVWEAALGKSAAAITVADVKSYLVSKGLYPQGSQDDNYTDENNIVNLFTTYHILPERLAPANLVTHYNELGYDYRYNSGVLSIPVEEFYTTLGQRRLLKIYESKESYGVYLNRFPVLRNGRGPFMDTSDASNNDYHESGEFLPTSGNALTQDENQGILVYQRDVNPIILQALNGVIYPISQLLAYTENVRTQFSLQRLRFDAASLLPEMMNNDLRRPMGNYSSGSSTTRGFPASQEFQYFENLDIAVGTRFYYLSGYNRGWHNYQGDEFNVVGDYEFTLKLPPVPADGTYELRMGVSANSTSRSIAQFSLGTDKEHLVATELPIDLRVGGLKKRIKTGDVKSNIGWEEDTEDEVHNRFVDLYLHEQGYMKGPNSHTAGMGSSAPSLRTDDYNLRRVVWRGTVEAGKTYYLHVKNCMPREDLQFYMDYIEWCPKNVYANPTTPEDIW